jgi:hypothetical protein
MRGIPVLYGTPCPVRAMALLCKPVIHERAAGPISRTVFNCYNAVWMRTRTIEMSETMLTKVVPKTKMKYAR